MDEKENGLIGIFQMSGNPDRYKIIDDGKNRKTGRTSLQNGVFFLSERFFRKETDFLPLTLQKLGPHWSRGWIIEDCEIADSKCSGISLGKNLQPENENKWMTGYVKDGTQTDRYRRP